MIEIEIKFGAQELAKVLNYYDLFEESSEFKLVCPFHEDVNPSMKVNLAEGNFYCFGCATGGNAFDFVRMANPKLDDISLWKLYFQILNGKKSSEIDIDKKVLKKKEGKHSDISLTEAEDYYFNLKNINWIEEDSAEVNYMLRRGFTRKALNICQAKYSYRQNYPIIFPMFDMYEFKGWVCRTMDKRIEKRRKYLYNTGFMRRDTIVGEYDSKVVVIVEGYMDWLKFRQNGMRKVGAILGWKITSDQIMKLKNARVKTIISALDSDQCGNLGTEKLAEHFNVVRFQFPEGVKDPGEMSPKQFEEAITRTKKLLGGK